MRSRRADAPPSRLLADLQRQAFEDPLTGLPNRRAFDRALAGAAGGALAVIDLDGFKRVNDRLGHTVGDQLLQAVAAVARPLVPAGATLARLGGDEFALVAPPRGLSATGTDAAEEVVAAAAAVIGAIGTVRFAGRLSGSAGVAPVGDPATALRDAGVALGASKRSGPGRVTQLDPVLQAEASRLAVLAADLGEALDRDEVELRLQPISSLLIGDVVGVEASVCWDHPGLGEVAPRELLAVAALAGLVERLGERAVSLVVDQARAWAQDGRQIPITLPVPSLEVCEPGFAPWLAERAAGLEGRLVVEVVASAVEDARASASVAALDANGFGVTLAGFGAGRSPLGTLCRVPARTVKLDARSIGPVDGDGRAAVVLEAVVALGHRLGLVVAADGIDDAATLRLFRDLGCDLGQGEALGRPVRVAELDLQAVAPTGRRS